MSGHSKWATTKHKKAIIDSRRAKSFAKLIKNIEVAARMGGPDLAGNPGLELAVTKAKKTSVPNDNIDRAIKRGAGLTGEVVDYTEIMYEARGPQGSALLVECLTDNKNRAASEVRLAICHPSQERPQRGRRPDGRPGRRRGGSQGQRRNLRNPLRAR
jgi:YebC/PmpR family DNA-binding regulatory protein